MALMAVSVMGCAPEASVYDQEGVLLAHVKRGFCLAGCNVKVRFADGTTCDGYAPGMNYSHPLAATVYCPDAPTGVLIVNDIARAARSIGTFTPDASLFSNQVDIDAVVKRHVPNPET